MAEIAVEAPAGKAPAKQNGAERKKAKQKTPLRKRGALANSNRTVRAMVWVVLLVSSAALTFAQLGFVGIGLEGQFTAYAVVLLLPIALSALLLGVLPGTLTGLFAGVVLFVHAHVMPLDYYEMEFVTPISSIVLLTVSGFLLGIMFAIALRKRPSAVKTVIYILIVCLIVSWLFSLLFIFNVFLELMFDLYETLGPNTPQAELEEMMNFQVSTVVLRLGSLTGQARVDTLLMAIVCIVAEFSVRKLEGDERLIGMQKLFGVWLFVVVLLAFMATTVISFIAITESERALAADDMGDEISYVESQLAMREQKDESIVELFSEVGVDFADIPEESLEKLLNSLSYSDLLEGYDSESDGLIAVFNDADESSERWVFLSDDPRFELDKPIDDSVNEEILNAIDVSAETGMLVRVVDDGGITEGDPSTWADRTVGTHISYVLAKDIDGACIMVMRPADKVHSGRGTTMLLTTLSTLVLLLAVFVLTSQLLKRVVVRRVDETNAVLARITGGDLDARVDVRNTREFDSLSNGINDTVVALNGWISEAETRMDTELKTAKAIQESVLPRTFPPFPDIQRFDIYASMHAAREVGGDFYDFFLVGDDADAGSGKLGFVIADVSGKGVPAALFMMNAKALVRDYMEHEVELGEVIENANRKLCENNDTGMFVTLFAGVLDYATGHIDFVNAGHNPPLIWQRDGGWRWLKEKSGLPLGLFEGLPYTAYSVDCTIGDQLLMYTDGVTEAMNVDDELYGEGRLEEIAKANYLLHPRALVGAVRHDVAKFATGAVQSDDITILALEVGVPPEVTATLVVPADVDALPTVNEFIHNELDRRLCPVRVQHQLDIATEELFVNVAHYAYANLDDDRPKVARVSYTYSADPPSITVTIADDGVPYNPLEKPDAVTPDDIADVPIGGLGILMAKRSVDEMSYEYVDGSNIVTIVKKW